MYIRADKSPAQDGGDLSVEIGDRNFGNNHKTLHDLTEKGVNFVVRIKQELKLSAPPGRCFEKVFCGAAGLLCIF